MTRRGSTRRITGGQRRALTMVSLKLTVTPAQAGKALKVANVDRANGNRGAGAYTGEQRRGA